MKKLFLFIFTITLLNACVSKRVYEELEAKYDKLRSNSENLFAENQDLIAQKKALEESKLQLKSEVDRLDAEKERVREEVAQLEERKQKLEAAYSELENLSEQQLSKKAEENKKLLVQLQEKEAKLAEESDRLDTLQKELDQKSSRIDQLESLIAAKENAMQQLKDAVSAALSGFEGRGLTVERKNGKVYVSMENKLLFKSGSWAVNNEGQKAVINLAEVLTQNPDINVLIEGHTDNVPYNGKGGILLDNWDLSVKRATAIVRILINNDVNPKQVTAAGRSKFMPVGSNATDFGRAKNRRIEIILAPNLDEINQLLGE
ncbi:MAG: cell envelope biogenesis protein OmpA [Flavobacteriales bacterium]|nr:MAG: cell envelope biogenesis protein OmpA [Flavobacteriales bacterium]